MILQIGSYAYQATLKQVDRCLHRIEHPDIQGLLLNGYRTVTLFTEPLIRLTQNRHTYYGVTGDVFVSTPYGLEAFPVLSCRRTLEAARSAVAQLLQALRRRKGPLVKEVSPYLNYPVLTTGPLSNPEVVNKHYKYIAKKLQKAKARDRKLSYSSTQESALLEILRNVPKGGFIVVVKAGPKQAKKFIKTIQKHNCLFAYVRATNTDESPKLTDELAPDTALKSIQELFERTKKLNKDNLQLKTNIAKGDRLVLFAKNIKDAEQLLKEQIRSRLYLSYTEAGLRKVYTY